MPSASRMDAIALLRRSALVRGSDDRPSRPMFFCFQCPPHTLDSCWRNQVVRPMASGVLSDQFSLLSPLHLAWDESATVEETGEAPVPIGEGSNMRGSVHCGSASSIAGQTTLVS